MPKDFPTLPFQQLVSFAEQCGMELVGAVAVRDLLGPLADETNRLEQWQGHGYAGEMGYMQRSPTLFADFRNILPEARSVVSFLVPYHGVADPPAGAPPQGYGRVARYAWGQDYHLSIRRRLRQFVGLAVESLKLGVELPWRVFTDAVPILERAVAREAGLGFIGKNTLLIRPKIGSYFFIGELLWPLQVEAYSPSGAPKARGSCGSCTRCISHCPTAAIVNPHILDARRCISYLTIEKRSVLSCWESEAIGEWLFGCDICQEVCPFNHSAAGRVGLDEFLPSSGAGTMLSLDAVLSLRTRRDFERRFRQTALMRTGRAGLLRNAICVTVNRRYLTALDAIVDCARSDPEPVVRAQARQELERIAVELDGAQAKRVAQVLKRVQV